MVFRTSRLNRYSYLFIGFALPLLSVGCGSRNESQSTAAMNDKETVSEPRDHDTDEAGLAPTSSANERTSPSEVLDDEFFVDPVSSDVRPVDVRERLTRAVIVMAAEDLKDKHVKGYVFYVRRDGEWWVDSVHDH